MRDVSVITFPGVNLLDVAGPAQVFTSASEVIHETGADADPAYRVTLVSMTGGLIPTSAGIALQSEPVGALAGRAIDTLLIPGGSGFCAAAADEDLIRWIRETQPRTRRLGSVCTGAFILARTALAEGRRLATHWAYCERLQAEFPTVEVERDALYVESGGIWSSAGIASGIDLALAMVEQDFGRELALLVSRRLVVYLKRSGGQSQFSLPLQAQIAEGRLSQLVEWIAQHPAADHRVERLAARSNVSVRTLHRLFRERFGRSPAEWVLQVRLETARRQLEETTASIEQIAVRTGFRSAEAMRRVFLRQLDVQPTVYRERFRRKTAASPPALQLAMYKTKYHLCGRA